MEVALKFISSQKLWRSIVVGAITVLISGVAHTQNLDQGKSPARLFADSCAACHHSARGLSRGRFSLRLFRFLRDHYTSDSVSAWALTSYLESVDSPHRQSRASAKRSPPAVRPVPSSMRPSMPVPRR